jgi:hypothetical protein
MTTKAETKTETKTEPKAPETKITDPPITSRFIACTQSTGRVGKSFLAQGIISALKFEKVPYTAIDADRQHRTLKRRHPEIDAFDATKSIDDFFLMIQALPPAPVILVDFPAQATDFLLDASEKLQLLEFFDKKGIRITFLIFAADDRTARESASDTVRFFGDRADYLLVENPARFKSDGFKRTPFADWLAERHTPTMKIPYVTTPTMEAWERLEVKLGHSLMLDEVIKHPDMHELSRLELDYVRNRFLVQCEDYANRILPSAELIKAKVFRMKEVEKTQVSYLDDPFFKV